MDNNLNDNVDQPALSNSELEILQQFRDFQQSRESVLRDALVCRHLHLVHNMSRRFNGLGESMEDLIQEGSIGLLKAVDMYDPERGVKFSTYASHLITSQIQHYLRDRGRLIRQPAWIQELNTKVQRTTEQLTQELGRDPQLAEVAERLNLSESSISSAVATRDLNNIISLTAPSDNNTESDIPLLDKDKSLSTKLNAMQIPIEDRIFLDEAISKLKTLEQNVIRLFFYEDLNQSEIARKLGISVNYASYLLRRAINKLRAMLDHDEAEAEALMVPEEQSVLDADVPTFDRYTGLYTEFYLRARIAEEIARGRRYPTNFSLMLLEITDLAEAEKNNDYLDMVTTIGQVFRQNTRIIDLICYPGNGCFAFLLPHTGRESRVLGQRLSLQVNKLYTQLKPVAKDTAVNLGYAVFPMDGSSVEILFKRAQLSMDKMKNNDSVADNVS